MLWEWEACPGASPAGPGPPPSASPSSITLKRSRAARLPRWPSDPAGEQAA